VKNLWQSIIIFALACGIFTPAAARTNMFPPEKIDAFYERWFGGQLRAMREPPLWTPQAIETHPDRIRLLVLPVFYKGFAVRIDRMPDGKGLLVAKLLSGRGGYKAGEIEKRRSISLSAAQLAILDQKIAASGIWKFYPEAFNQGEDEVCLDGIEVVLERNSAKGHQYSNANIVCSVSSGFINVMREILALAEIQVVGLNFRF
jgi:hypothetical protein